MIRVLISASSPVVRAGLESLVSTGDFAVSTRPLRLPQLPADVDANHPDVVLIAVDDEDESELLAALPPLIDQPRTPAVVLLRHGLEPEWAAEAWRAGARAVLPMESTADELRAAIVAAARGLSVFAGDSARTLFRDGAPPAAPLATATNPLTPREIDVLQMLAGGMGNKAIAARLNISTHTVKFHVAAIMSKLGAASRTEAVTLGLRRGLILL